MGGNAGFLSLLELVFEALTLSDFLTQECELTLWEAFLPCEKGVRYMYCPCPAVEQKITFSPFLLSPGDSASKAQFSSLIPSGHKIHPWLPP